MSGFTTTTTLAVMINKRSMRKRKNKNRFKRSFKAPQRLLKVKG